MGHRKGHSMEEIIVIRATDPDGSLFRAIIDALKDKRAEVIHAAAPASPVLHIGELEIHHEHRQVFVAGRVVRLNHGGIRHALLHGQCPWAGLLKGAALQGGLGRRVSAWDELRGEYHLAAEKETGGGSQTSGVHKNGGGSGV